MKTLDEKFLLTIVSELIRKSFDLGFTKRNGKFSKEKFYFKRKKCIVGFLRSCLLILNSAHKQEEIDFPMSNVLLHKKAKQYYKTSKEVLRFAVRSLEQTGIVDICWGEHFWDIEKDLKDGLMKRKEYGGFFTTIKKNECLFSKLPISSLKNMLNNFSDDDLFRYYNKAKKAKKDKLFNFDFMSKKRPNLDINPHYGKWIDDKNLEFYLTRKQIAYFWKTSLYSVDKHLTDRSYVKRVWKFFNFVDKKTLEKKEVWVKTKMIDVSYCLKQLGLPRRLNVYYLKAVEATNIWHDLIDLTNTKFYLTKYDQEISTIKDSIWNKEYEKEFRDQMTGEIVQQNFVYKPQYKKLQQRMFNDIQQKFDKILERIV